MRSLARSSSVNEAACHPFKAGRRSEEGYMRQLKVSRHRTRLVYSSSLSMCDDCHASAFWAIYGQESSASSCLTWQSKTKSMQESCESGGRGRAGFAEASRGFLFAHNGLVGNFSQIRRQLLAGLNEQLRGDGWCQCRECEGEQNRLADPRYAFSITLDHSCIDSVVACIQLS